jgi:lysylphosphatidylglycerol synthetase-like protein (DUF2156 family)
MNARIIEGSEARNITSQEKWQLLGPYLRQHGREALSYATLQAGMEYFILPDVGYIAYVTVRHLVLSPRPRKIALVDPVCAVADYPIIIRQFLNHCPRATFVPSSIELGRHLHDLGFKVNCVGVESELPVQTYNTKGNWKDLDLIRRARNEARREKMVIREEPDISTVNREQLLAMSKRWVSSKVLNDREIWIYARPPIFAAEEDVRKFVAYDCDAQVAGFVFYDPIYRDGKVVGYACNTSRCDETRFSKLSTAIHMTAMEQFRDEGKETLNLCLSPFERIETGDLNDDRLTMWFFQISRRYGEGIYNFGGLSFFKSKYRGIDKPKYFASNGLFPSNDLYLAYLSSNIVRSYFATMGKLLLGVVVGQLSRLKRDPSPAKEQPTNDPPKESHPSEEPAAAASPEDRNR